MFEGCPVVHLSDSPEDVVHFLRVLLPKSRRTLYAQNPRIPFRRFSAIIRLAHKYHVQDVLDQAIAALEKRFATWDSKAADAAVVCKLKHAVGAVNLARLVDKPSLLPIAFYQCALLGGRVVNGYWREDKSIEHLAQGDVIRCIDGRNKLALVSEVFLLDPCEACVTPSRCTGALKTMLEDALGSDDASDPDILHDWGGAIKHWAEDLLLCGACKRAAIDRDAAERRRVWAALPQIFDIKVEGWNGVGGDGGDSTHSAAAV